MSAATTIAQAFGEEANLYRVVLGIDTEGDTTAITPSQLRKAYYRRALKVRVYVASTEHFVFSFVVHYHSAYTFEIQSLFCLIVSS
jgi:hypothetical protein